jgi:tau tubulin kinase
LHIATETLNRLEQLHDAGWLNRDVKAVNFAVGLGEKARQVFMLDFGYARRFQ